jgi:hypothetical protein
MCTVKLFLIRVIKIQKNENNWIGFSWVEKYAADKMAGFQTKI